MHECTVLREDLVQITPAPQGVYVALFANVETRSIEEIEVHTFGLVDQLLSDGTTNRLGTAIILDTEGVLTPVYQADNFLGVLDRMELLNGTPAWILDDLDGFLAEWDQRDEELN